MHVPSNRSDHDGADDLDNIPAGEEVDDSLIDDAERDEIAERERLAAEAGEAPPSTEDILEDVRKAMVEEAPAPEPEETPEAKAAREAAEKAAAEATPAPDGKAAPVGTQAAPDDAAAKAAAEKAETERKAAVDKEADKLGIKSKTARDRFHELNRTVTEQGEAIKALSTLAGKDAEGKEITGPAAVEAVKHRIARHVEFEDAIFSSGISADDFKNVAGYKAAINSDDPAAWENARQFLRTELAWLETERMGLRPKEEGAEAYTMHEDLKNEVATGELSAKRANEIAETRGVQASVAKVRTERAAAAGTEEARTSAATLCGDYAQTLQEADKAQFVAKWPVLRAKLGELQATVSPDKWLPEMIAAYKAIPYTPVPAQRAPEQPARAPLRPGQLPRAGVRRVAGRDAEHPMRRASPDDPMEAMRQAMFEAGGGAAVED